VGNKSRPAARESHGAGQTKKSNEGVIGAAKSAVQDTVQKAVAATGAALGLDAASNDKEAAKEKLKEEIKVDDGDPQIQSLNDGPGQTGHFEEPQESPVELVLTDAGVPAAAITEEVNISDKNIDLRTGVDTTITSTIHTGADPAETEEVATAYDEPEKVEGSPEVSDVMPEPVMDRLSDVDDSETAKDVDAARFAESDAAFADARDHLKIDLGVEVEARGEAKNVAGNPVSTPPSEEEESKIEAEEFVEDVLGEEAAGGAVTESAETDKAEEDKDDAVVDESGDIILAGEERHEEVTEEQEQAELPRNPKKRMMEVPENELDREVKEKEGEDAVPGQLTEKDGEQPDPETTAIAS
jgi:hypothetical protein